MDNLPDDHPDSLDDEKPPRRSGGDDLAYSHANRLPPPRLSAARRRIFLWQRVLLRI
ncbi:MAG: hypothetical protein ACI4WT_10365 [Oligosphaeraceae bacterium]